MTEKFIVENDGIYKVVRTYSPSCFSGEYASEIRELVMPRDILIEAFTKWGITHVNRESQGNLEANI